MTTIRERLLAWAEQRLQAQSDEAAADLCTLGERWQRELIGRLVNTLPQADPWQPVAGPPRGLPPA